jgi:hypothetical protein
MLAIAAGIGLVIALVVAIANREDPLAYPLGKTAIGAEAVDGSASVGTCQALISDARVAGRVASICRK